jgi:hypothetical protein
MMSRVRTDPLSTGSRLKVSYLPSFRRTPEDDGSLQNQKAFRCARSL